MAAARAIAVHHGRVVKRTGDGAVVEFRSVVDAVRCAIEVQSAMVERNAGVPPRRNASTQATNALDDVTHSPNWARSSQRDSARWLAFEVGAASGEHESGRNPTLGTLMVGLMAESLGFGYVIRFRGNVHVTAADGQTRQAADWVGKAGRARLLRGAELTAARHKVRPGLGMNLAPVGVEYAQRVNFDGLYKIALADAETRAGDRVRAIAILDEALATADRLAYRAFEAELNRTRLLAHAYAQCRSNKGAPGVDRQDFEAVEGTNENRQFRTVFLKSWSETKSDERGFPAAGLAVHKHQPRALDQRLEVRDVFLSSEKFVCLADPQVEIVLRAVACFSSTEPDRRPTKPVAPRKTTQQG